mmetsp:Transcript_14633/g.43966  ORF Transcript_14633/g.43966 Transcript_14633/m.43966 type:complete len:294 (+) Transcript_14633:1723-2604(+)
MRFWPSTCMRVPYSRVPVAKVHIMFSRNFCLSAWKRSISMVKSPPLKTSSRRSAWFSPSRFWSRDSDSDSPPPPKMLADLRSPDFASSASAWATALRLASTSRTTIVRCFSSSRSASTVTWKYCARCSRKRSMMVAWSFALCVHGSEATAILAVTSTRLSAAADTCSTFSGVERSSSVRRQVPITLLSSATSVSKAEARSASMRVLLTASVASDASVSICLARSWRMRSALPGIVDWFATVRHMTQPSVWSVKHVAVDVAACAFSQSRSSCTLRNASSAVSDRRNGISTMLSR